MKLILKIAFLISFTTLTIFLLGCQNTVQGFGKDMQNTGREIQKSAN